MSRRQPAGDLRPVLDRLARRKRLAPEPLAQCFALQKLRHSIGVSGLAVKIVDGENVRVR